MRVLAIFNTVGPDNIGLENFVAQEGTVDARILVVGQESDAARTFLATNYPGHEGRVESIREWAGGWWTAGLRAMRDLDADIVHVHHTAGAVVAASARMVRRFRLVATAHNDFSKYRWYQKLGFLFAFLLSDRVVCNSEGTRRSLPRLIRRGKVSVIHNGVDFGRLDRILGEKVHSASSATMVVGTVCRMVPQKDLHTLVRGFAKARQRVGEGLVLRLVGDGPDRDGLAALVCELGLEEVVEFTGALSRDEAYRELSGMDLFVVSSRWEGFCNAMVEAAAAGKPVIATDISPLPEVIGWNNAEFFPVGDSGALADRIEELAKSPERRTEVAARGRDFVRGRYSLEASADRYWRLYAEIAAAG